MSASEYPSSLLWQNKMIHSYWLSFSIISADSVMLPDGIGSSISGCNKKIGIVVAIVAIAVGIGLASPLFYEVDIDEPIPTGSITESAEMMEKLAESV